MADADIEWMLREIVTTVNVRMNAVEVGDIVNRNPDDGRGWFIVDSITDIGPGKLALADAGSQNSASGQGIEVITVQITAMVDFEQVAAAAAGAGMSQAPAAGPSTPVVMPEPAAEAPLTSLFAGRNG